MYIIIIVKLAENLVSALLSLLVGSTHFRNYLNERRRIFRLKVSQLTL